MHCEAEILPYHCYDIVREGGCSTEKEDRKHGTLKKVYVQVMWYSFYSILYISKASSQFLRTYCSVKCFVNYCEKMTRMLKVYFRSLSLVHVYFWVLKIKEFINFN